MLLILWQYQIVAIVRQADASSGHPCSRTLLHGEDCNLHSIAEVERR